VINCLRGVPRGMFGLDDAEQHQAAITTLISLIHHLSPRVKD
jgi:hypothetical protein